MANVSYIMNPLRNPWFWMFFACLFVMYLTLGLSLQEAGILSEETRWYSFQARTVWWGDPGGLGIIGVETPPIPHIPYLLLIHPVLVASFVAAFSMGFLILYILKHYQTLQVKVFLIALLILSPSMLFLSLQSPRTIIFFMLNILSFYFLMEFSVKEESFFIMIFGLIFGMLVLIDFSIIFSLIFLFIFFFLFFKKMRVLEYTFVSVFPLVFLFLSWILLNTMFTNDPAATISGWFAAFSPKNGFRYLIQFLHSSAFFVILYGFTLIVVGRFLRFFRSPLFFTLVLPWCNLILLGFFHESGAFMANSKLLLINYIILFPYIGRLMNERRLRNIIAFLFLLTLVWEFVGVRRNTEEDVFFQWLTAQPVVSISQESKSILALFSDQERIWVSDPALYSALYHSDDLSRWVLPNHEDHGLVSMQPSLYVGWIFTIGSDQRPYSDFDLIYESKKYKILQNRNPEMMQWGKELRSAYSP